jgi:soluble lytic murein transglycosylase-like protein
MCVFFRPAGICGNDQDKNGQQGFCMFKSMIFALFGTLALVAESARAEPAVYTLRPAQQAYTARAYAPQGSIANDPFICHREISRTERMMGIPPQLLESVALTESGRWQKAYNRQVAWPWTVNANGKGYYLNSKAEAIAKVKSLQRSGIRSIDVGCMQVNLHFHKEAFTSVEMALEPAYNVRYAAKFLRDLRVRNGTWSGAVGNYHSGTPALHNKYRLKVLQTWQKNRRTYASNTINNAMRQRYALLEQRRMNRIRVASYQN